MTSWHNNYMRCVCALCTRACVVLVRRTGSRVCFGCADHIHWYRDGLRTAWQPPGGRPRAGGDPFARFDDSSPGERGNLATGTDRTMAGQP